MDDRSNGYDEVAEVYGQGRSKIGASQVSDWASKLVTGADVLDVGCGDGIPITAALLEAGCRVHAVDASPRMVALFESRFPGVPVLCEPVQTSTLFGRSFDGVVSWGLLFLLEPHDQLGAIDRLAGAVGPGGELLFTAPWPVAEWTDNLTGRPSWSLGADVYRRAIEAAGLTLVREFDDEGENHYYQAVRSRRAL